jgi:hypothetical protein
MVLLGAQWVLQNFAGMQQGNIHLIENNLAALSADAAYPEKT